MSAAQAATLPRAGAAAAITRSEAGRRVEAARQRTLLAALFAPPDATADEAALAAAGCAEAGARARRGLGVYRGNAAALAERALGAAHPTLAALVGPEGLAALARGLWHAAPPRRGDVAQWGDELPAFIASRPELAAWPWLADCARLDAAVARCEAAPAAALEADTLGLLAAHEPARLRLHLRPDVQLLRSRWPVAALRAAHEGVDAQAAAPRVRAVLAAPRGESVVVARAGWRAVPVVVDVPCFAWMQALQEGRTLDATLRRAGPAFDFDAWLLQALRHGWLRRAEVSDPVPAFHEGVSP